MLRLSGEFDVAAREDLRRKIEAALALTDEDLVVDLRDVTYMDSVALGVLISVQKRLRGGQRRLKLLIAAQSSMSKILQITGVDRIFDVSTEEPAAEGPAPELGSGEALPDPGLP